MTKDDIIRMAREAGAHVAHHDLVEYWNPTLERFAALVASAERERIADEAKHIIKRAEARGAAAEREACAKVCEDAISSIWEFHPEYVNQVGKNVCTNLAAAIRARSKQ